jgi:hypothetical protein
VELYVLMAWFLIKHTGFTFHLSSIQLVPRSRISGAIPPLSIRLDGVMLNYLSTGTTLSISVP